MPAHRIYSMSFASIYRHYVAKAEKKGRTSAEVDEILRWQTGYDPAALEAQIAAQVDVQTFYADAPHPNPSRSLITGVVCGVRVEDVEDPLMREIRYTDKLIDELAKGKAMDKILRAAPGRPAGRLTTSPGTATEPAYRPADLDRTGGRVKAAGRLPRPAAPTTMRRCLRQSERR